MLGTGSRTRGTTPLRPRLATRASVGADAPWPG